jgi:hypothetical protein
MNKCAHPTSASNKYCHCIEFLNDTEASFHENTYAGLYTIDYYLS